MVKNVKRLHFANFPWNHTDVSTFSRTSRKNYKIQRSWNCVWRYPRFQPFRGNHLTDHDHFWDSSALKRLPIKKSFLWVYPWTFKSVTSAFWRYTSVLFNSDFQVHWQTRIVFPPHLTYGKTIWLPTFSGKKIKKNPLKKWTLHHK